MGQFSDWLYNWTSLCLGQMFRWVMRGALLGALRLGVT
jgi:hypothetical protein